MDAATKFARDLGEFLAKEDNFRFSNHSLSSWFSVDTASPELTFSFLEAYMLANWKVVFNDAEDHGNKEGFARKVIDVLVRGRDIADCLFGKTGQEKYRSMNHAYDLRLLNFGVALNRFERDFNMRVPLDICYAAEALAATNESSAPARRFKLMGDILANTDCTSSYGSAVAVLFKSLPSEYHPRVGHLFNDTFSEGNRDAVNHIAWALDDLKSSDPVLYGSLAAHVDRDLLEVKKKSAAGWERCCP